MLAESLEYRWKYVSSHPHCGLDQTRIVCQQIIKWRITRNIRPSGANVRSSEQFHFSTFKESWRRAWFSLRISDSGSGSVETGHGVVPHQGSAHHCKLWTDEPLASRVACFTSTAFSPVARIWWTDLLEFSMATACFISKECWCHQISLSLCGFALSSRRVLSTASLYSLFAGMV